MAKRFQFRLEPVRKLRAQARDAQRRVVADAVRSVAAAEQRITEFDAQLRQTVQLTRGERLAQRVDISALRGQEFYRGLLHRRILETNVDLAKEARRLEIERAKLGEASARLKAIEKLRERRWARYRKDVAREEQGVSDDLSAAAYMRREATAGEAVGG